MKEDELQALLPYATEPQAATARAYHKHGTIKGAARELGVAPAVARRSIQRLRAHAAKYGGVMADADLVACKPADGFFIGKRTVQVDHRTGQVERSWDRHILDREQVRDALVEIFQDLPRVRLPKEKRPAVFTDDVGVIGIGDAHIGALIWGRETQHGDWDLDIARQAHLSCAADLVDAIPQAVKVLHVVDVGDFHHADNKRGVTERGGNILDLDSRYGKINRASIGIATDLIRLAKRKAGTVIWHSCPGNHNEHSSWWLSQLLTEVFRDDPYVQVVAPESHRHYWTEGENIFMATHGDRARKAKLPQIMALEHPDFRSQNQRRIILTGHLHHQETLNDGGCIVETFEVMVPPDAWHADHGFVGARRGMRSIVMPQTCRGIVRRYEAWI